MSQLLNSVYNISFIEKMETLLPQEYKLNKYYQSITNENQYIMRNSKGYFHIKEIVKTKYGFTFNHYRINKNEKIIDARDVFDYYDSIDEIKNIMN
jgi:hypothetical protein